jgi:hypothetical protein
VRQSTVGEIFRCGRARDAGAVSSTCDFTHFAGCTVLAHLPSHIHMEVAMHPAIQTSTAPQIISGSMFGAAFVHEHHSEERHFCFDECDDSVIDFAGFLNALRGMLSLR